MGNTLTFYARKILNVLNQDKVLIFYGALTDIYLLCLKKINNPKFTVMNIELTDKQMAMIAGKTAQMVVTLLEKNHSKQGREKKYVDINKAAEILGYSVYHLRRIKDQFPHIKRGDNQQGRLLFEEDALYASFEH